MPTRNNEMCSLPLEQDLPNQSYNMSMSIVNLQARAIYHGTIRVGSTPQDRGNAVFSPTVPPQLSNEERKARVCAVIDEALAIIASTDNSETSDL